MPSNALRNSQATKQAKFEKTKDGAGSGRIMGTSLGTGTGKVINGVDDLMKGTGKVINGTGMKGK